LDSVAAATEAFDEPLDAIAYKTIIGPFTGG